MTNTTKQLIQTYIAELETKLASKGVGYEDAKAIAENAPAFDDYDEWLAYFGANQKEMEAALLHKLIEGYKASIN